MTPATEALIELHEQCLKVLRKIDLAEMYRQCAQIHIEKGANVEWNTKVVQKWANEKQRLATLYTNLLQEIIEMVMNKRPRHTVSLAEDVYKDRINENIGNPVMQAQL